MENQHRKISGYRELSQAEIDLMNEIKAFGPQLDELIKKVQAHAREQIDVSDRAVAQSGDVHAALAEVDRIRDAEPLRWASIAKTDLQTGLMALTRAVAQPTFF